MPSAICKWVLSLRRYQQKWILLSTNNFFAYCTCGISFAYEQNWSTISKIACAEIYDVMTTNIRKYCFNFTAPKINMELYIWYIMRNKQLFGYRSSNSWRTTAVKSKSGNYLLKTKYVKSKTIVIRRTENPYHLNCHWSIRSDIGRRTQTDSLN